MRLPAVMLIGLLGLNAAQAAAPVSPAAPADTQETRLAAAQRYAAVANVQKMLRDSFEASAQSIPEKDRQAFVAAAMKFMRPEALETVMITAMVKHFTTQELDAMTTFYGSREGQTALAKFGEYMADVMPLVQAEIQRALQDMQKELREQQERPRSGA